MNNDITIYYGIENNNIDVTHTTLTKCVKNNILRIPNNDHIRLSIFKIDPTPYVVKSIFIHDKEHKLIGEYDHTENIEINLETNEIFCGGPKRLSELHNKLKLNFGSFTEEYPEQLMVSRYLKGGEKVLEIGGNIGRNSLVIASIVNNDNFVCLESDLNIANTLKHNRDINNFKFHIEPSALSKRKLIQKGWDTIASDVILDGYAEINITSYDTLKDKYNINFDTLVLDCEGAFYYILLDMPEILDNIKLIIMENDYYNHEHKVFIDEVLTKNNFYIDYVESGGWGPCSHNFYEVWMR